MSTAPTAAPGPRMITIRCPRCNKRLIDVRANGFHAPHIETVRYHRIMYDAELYCPRCGTFIGVSR